MGTFPKQAASINYVVGSLVWVEDNEEAWLDGEVVEVNGEELTVKCTTGNTVVANASRVHPKDPEAPPSGVDDMTKLAYLHEPGVLNNLKCRYDINEIYTYTGNILIAVNPFQRLPHLYDSAMKEKYRGAALGELSPHPFAIADSAYRMMLQEGISQSILVSGESGAGKTESTKSLMQFLAYMGGRANAEGRTVEQQVLESNPVLEAFGNAKTVRNNNSSRFGKFVEIQFDQRGRISGAAIRTYLLERSRVCQVSDPERNYHCFYMLCAAPKEVVERFKLDSPRTFHYLNQSNCYEVDVIDDAKEYLTTRRAMDVVGISSHEQDAIFKVVAAILHLGNIEFAKESDSDSSKPKDEKSRFHLRTAAELFMCDKKALEDSLCKRVIFTRGESITKNLDPDAATVSRDALAKIVYSRLFDWLVNKINSSIGQDPDSKFLIGVLDIYGFETFKTNSFEQFCINLTNEKLQQHFNQHVFKMEQEEYTREEIDWSYIEFVDNQDVLDLIEKKPGGIIALLDEACMFPRSTHETFAEKLYQTFSNHKRFSKPKLSRTDFVISHYAGEVTYQTEFFLDKNKDYVVPEHQELLSASECAFVASLFPRSPEESAKSSKFSSIGTSFKHQLQLLLETLSATEPHYIRCVKPNNLLKPAIFENSNVLHQLRCGGVMEAIRISCAGFPTRKPFHEFINRCCILAPEIMNSSYDEVTACRKILKKVQLDGYQIGISKVFLRAGQMAELDALRNEVLGQSATKIQKQIRTYFFHRWFKQMRLSAIHIQTFCRGQVARSVFDHKKKEAACLRIQKELRRHLARKSYLELYSSAMTIERGMRSVAARSELRFRRQTRAAIKIQSHCRRYKAQYHYRRMRKAAIITQCAWRSKMARRELRKLKMAAKEAGALKEAKNRLEKEVEELTSRLQLEKRMRDALEELKNQENEKLQQALEIMEKQFQETKTLLMKEREEAVKKAAEQVPIIQEVPVYNDELMSKLTVENEQLKECVSSLEKKIDETEKKHEEICKLNQESVSNNELIDKLSAENEQLQRLVSSLETKINETERKCAETSKQSEDPVFDNESINRLAVENKQLEEMVSLLEHKIDETQKKYEETSKLTEELEGVVSSLEQKIDETQKKYEETSKLSEERLKQSQEAESKMIGLKIAVHSLEEKIAYMETERKTKFSDYPDFPSGTPKKVFGTESMRKSHMERQRELADSLIKCVAGDAGFSQGKPVAAVTMYKCLLHWKTFDAERTNVFDRLTELISSAFQNSDNNSHLAYWLSNTTTLLFLLQRSFKANKDWKPPQPPTFFGRMAQGFRASPSSANLQIDIVRPVEAKQPALLFKQQLTAYVEMFFAIIRDNFKAELSPLLSASRQAPKTSEVAEDPSVHHLQDVIDCLDSFLNTLKENHVPKVYVQKIFIQIFSYINVQLFNSVLLNRECCTFSNGEYVKAGLDKLEAWCGEATDECTGSSWDELKHIRQAVGFLVINHKGRITFEDLTSDLCPLLSVKQLYKICTTYWDDDYNTTSVSPDVILSMKTSMPGENEGEMDSDKACSLHDNSSIPLPVDDLSPSLDERDFAGVKPPPLLLENPDFQFLQE
ncbi:myosin-6-like isoform X2 [Chenopodium quinoa]|uniref:myosin-6-like isoform X2 n=1 Tax=Chenopodium quinoa TaxID=63459 RepID=UPI000B7813B2|nr:myosin-6-like isoform X2 [Chenopodium quinoa]